MKNLSAASEPGLSSVGSARKWSGAAAMMGEQRQGSRGAVWRALGAMVPADHILRRIDGLLDMGELRDAVTPHTRQGTTLDRP
jgi:hypothetical protein